MKIVITSRGETLDSPLDPRFGRAQYFLFVNPDTQAFQATANPNIDAMGGAGIQSAQLVAREGAEVVITGSCGPNAFEALTAAGVRVFVGASGSVNEVLDDYKSGRLKIANGPDVPSHSGTGPGIGRGRGLGVGRHIGRGKFAPEGGPTEVVSESGRPSSSDSEIEVLKQQAEGLRNEMEAIEARIHELERRGKDERGE
jgi:predicted Fe-Mo cluster-binding NifX family protein